MADKGKSTKSQKTSIKATGLCGFGTIRMLLRSILNIVRL